MDRSAGGWAPGDSGEVHIVKEAPWQLGIPLALFAEILLQARDLGVTRPSLQVSCTHLNPSRLSGIWNHESNMNLLPSMQSQGSSQPPIPTLLLGHKMWLTKWKNADVYPAPDAAGARNYAKSVSIYDCLIKGHQFWFATGFHSTWTDFNSLCNSLGNQSTLPEYHRAKEGVRTGLFQIMAEDTGLPNLSLCP